MPERFALSCRGFRFITLGLFIMKKERHTYEAYCRAFAGIYAKHAKNGGNYFTCYVREAIVYFLSKDETERGILLDDAGRESLVGYKIAYSLLKAGWPEDIIIEYTDIQQERVDEAERRLSFEEAVIHRYNIPFKPQFAISMNAYRYAWLIDGAPSLDEDCDDLIECQYDDDYEDC